MKYTTSADKNYTTSVLNGPDQPRRIIDGAIVRSSEYERSPLVRVYSRDLSTYENGRYGLAVRRGQWHVRNERFVSMADAEECISGLHLTYAEVAVVQFWDDGTKLARESDVDDEFTGEI